MSEVHRKKAVMNWSGGKDAAHALLRVLEGDEYEVVALLTTVNRDTECSTMHALPHALLQRQAESIGIPLYEVQLTPKGNMEDYAAAMERAVTHFREMGVTHFIFGDIFLHDVRSYREAQLAPLGMEVVEPLWGKPSHEVMEEFLASGLKCRVVTTLRDGLGEGAIGKLIDREFVASLPADADPNGENGEYHTLCYDGPIFRHPVEFSMGEPRTCGFEIGQDDGTSQWFYYCFGDPRC